MMDAQHAHMRDLADEPLWHYFRACAACGYGWASLHCPHEGIQTPCSQCGHRNAVSLDYADDVCPCEFDV